MADDQRPAVKVRSRLAVILAVLALLAGVAFAKALQVGSAAPETSTPETGSAPDTAVSPSETRGNPAAIFDRALADGRPVYVLFHSLTCEPCKEISLVVDTVVPEYADRIVFVNVITDDPGAKELSRRFAFQYIPTSFFVTGQGDIADSHTGTLTEDELRARLDDLATP